MIVLVIPVLAIIVITVHDLLRRPTLRRLAFRNAVRRPGEAGLVLIGSLLATAIITASFIVGDTLGASIRDFARTQLGPVDEIVRVVDAKDLPPVAQALASPVRGSDGVVSMVRTGASAATVSGRARAEPSAALNEIDFEAARRFGRDPAATGLADAGPTPTGDQAVIGKDLADSLEVTPGDKVRVFAYGNSRTFTVRQVVPRVGLAGFWVERGSDSPNLFVAPGTIAALAAGSTVPGAAPPTGMVLVSNDGGIFAGADATPTVASGLRERLKGVPNADLQTVKQDLLDNADAGADSFTQLFGGIGAFSVIAGILLLVNIFVMLADERKSELGMLRAVGMKRNHLVRAFGMEGALYAVVASVIGALAGIGVGRAIVVIAQRIFNSGDEDFQISMRFTAKPGSIVIGMVIGAVISLLTVWGASIRIGRLNIIRAIRDQAEPPVRRQRPRTVILAAAGVLLGGLMFVSGAAGKSWFPTLVGIPIAALSAIPLLSRVLPRRPVVSLACIVALVWGIGVFTFLPSVFQEADIPIFVVQGVILVAAAVMLITTNDDVAVQATERLAVSNRTLAARLGLAYPLARKFRTAMLLGMYALVIFTLTFLAVFSKLFSDQTPRFTRELSAGYSVVLDSNRANPATAETLEQQPGVAAATPLLRAFPEFSTAKHPEPDHWPLSGFSAGLLSRGTIGLSSHLARFPTERATWQAVLADPSLTIVPDFFLQEGGGPPSSTLHPGDKVTVYNRGSGQQRVLTVAGITDSDFVNNGVLVNAEFARSFFGPDAVPERQYVAVHANADPERVADDLTGRLLAQGVDAKTFASVIHDGLKQNEGFFTLMQGYLALGLLIGIAGLGVVMVRAVRERRRQIGMLRAMGFSHRVVRSSFLFEAAFVAIQGTVLGVVLGLIVSYQLLVNSSAFGDQRLGFSVPWAALLIVLSLVVLASLAAAFTPANQASRIKPAVALRIAD